MGANIYTQWGQSLSKKMENFSAGSSLHTMTQGLKYEIYQFETYQIIKNVVQFGTCRKI